MIILCVICLIGAGAVMVRDDPWVKADHKAAQDAALLADLQPRPDRIGMRLTEDLSLVALVLWGAGGALRYPAPDGFTPVQYELSPDLIRDVTLIQSHVASSEWARFRASDQELLHCRAQPALCLIYNRANLETSLGL